MQSPHESAGKRFLTKSANPKAGLGQYFSGAVEQHEKKLLKVP